MIPDRLAKYISITPNCWLWNGATLKSGGYGVGTDPVTKKLTLAHRLIYKLLVREIPSGMQLDHLCRVRQCVNPQHLEVVTPRENTLRGNTITARHARKTHCKNGHKFTEENTYIPSTRYERVCRQCDRARQKKWKLKVS